MEALLPDSVKRVLVALLAVWFVLACLARARPDIGWLQVFRFPTPNLCEEERARRKRSADRRVAAEIVLVGLALPLLYVVSTVMMFNDFKTLPTVIVSVSSLSCIALGIWIFARNR